MRGSRTQKTKPCRLEWRLLGISRFCLPHPYIGKSPRGSFRPYLEEKMDTRELSRIIKFAILSCLLIGIGIAASSNAAAQRRNRWDGYPNWGGSYQLRETALNAGYNEGQKEGRNDRSHNRYRNYSEFSAYNNATKDYSSRLGDRDLYQRYFRAAFESAYDTENPNSYRRNDRDYNRESDQDRNNQTRQRRWGRNWDLYGQFGGSYELRQTALNAGYNEGNKQGRNDRKKNRPRSYSDFSSYRDATTDYSSKLGDKDLYRRYYRQGFENGYEDGLRGY